MLLTLCGIFKYFFIIREALKKLALLKCFFLPLMMLLASTASFGLFQNIFRLEQVQGMSRSGNPCRRWFPLSSEDTLWYGRDSGDHREAEQASVRERETLQNAKCFCTYHILKHKRLPCSHWWYILLMHLRRTQKMVVNKWSEITEPVRCLIFFFFLT